MACESDSEEVVSPVEQLKSIFDLCDKDNDGLLTVNEFRTLSHQFLGAATQQAEKLIKELDPDNSGVINFENFWKGTQSYLLARRDSGSPLSDSLISLNGFGDDHMLTSSPTAGSTHTCSMTSVHNIHHSTPDCVGHYQYQYNNNNASEIELTANGTDEDESPHHVEQEPGLLSGLQKTSSLAILEVQPSGVSPTLMARALMKRNNHSFLHVSGGNSSYSSTPDWTLDDEQDELTDKLLELSTRLEGLEIDLDSSQAQTLHLKRENLALRERIETFEERLREAQIDKEAVEKKSLDSLRQTKAQLKRKHNEEMDELQAKLQEAQENIKLLESSNWMTRTSFGEAREECEIRKEELSSLRMRISELEDNLRQAKEAIQEERERWRDERTGNQQEITAMTHVIEHLRKELEDGKNTKKRQSVTSSDLRNAEITFLRKEIKGLKELNTRLSAQLLQHGKQLVAQKPQSLAEELEDAPRNEVMKALKEQEQYTNRLKSYIEGLLVTILEKHPELLEVQKC